MKSVFFFDSMLTTKIITFVYWILLLAALFSGVGSMFASYEGITFTSFISGLGIAVACAVGARIWCELMIVLFKIHANLQKIADREDA